MKGGDEMEDAEQYSEEENGVDPGPPTDDAALEKYFDYVSYIRHINFTSPG